ncbi:hypothetical protein [Blastopirellula retiformator]|uniref:Uncharacterized protein n=1 Tax=Blastopirellula retiformator TaxID=2527970 RepID=A0A5C5VKZ5_9BACT|nr:hypothetical protein [Blastopirellula retiformator]TWT38711.1 hypothetical protein Enr8_04050 [Blastopirellula retiformator]
MERSGALSKELAEYILSLQITDADQERVHALLEKNAADALSEAEREELDNLNHVADLLSLWHSQTRRSLRHP